MRVTKIGIFYHTDPVGNVPSGIDSFIRGILQWAPEDLNYYLFGATADPVARPVGHEAVVMVGEREVRYLPLISLDASGINRRTPLTVRYMLALRRILRIGEIQKLDILDFHRVEPVALFAKDRRYKNLVLHQDMSVIRDGDSDIKWRYAPRVYEAMERRLFSRLDTICCVRQSAVERYRLDYPNIASRFQFIPTWFDSATFSPARNAGLREQLRCRLRAELGLPSSRQLLTFVGRLDKQKDPALLLSSFQGVLRRSWDVHLVIIGDGILRRSVEDQLKAQGLSGHVTLLGARSRSEIADILRATDLFVLSSAYEGMPIAVLEALATGVPVVSTDVGEVRLVVQDGVNGRISGQRSPEAMADAIVAALQSLEAMSGKPCQVSVEPFSAEKVLARIYRTHRVQAFGLT